MSHGAPPDRPVSAEVADSVADAMFALSTPSRVRILGLLRERPHSVGELTEAIGMEQSAVSHQLRVLREHRLVVAERKGRQRVYALHDEHVASLLDEALEPCRPPRPTGEAARRDRRPPATRRAESTREPRRTHVHAAGRAALGARPRPRRRHRGRARHGDLVRHRPAPFAARGDSPRCWRSWARASSSWSPTTTPAASPSTRRPASTTGRACCGCCFCWRPCCSSTRRWSPASAR